MDKEVCHCFGAEGRLTDYVYQTGGNHPCFCIRVVERPLVKTVRYIFVIVAITGFQCIEVGSFVKVVLLLLTAILFYTSIINTLTAASVTCVALHD
jgi:hypothetical protein